MGKELRQSPMVVEYSSLCLSLKPYVNYVTTLIDIDFDYVRPGIEDT
jgi:hypothetical protein